MMKENELTGDPNTAGANICGLCGATLPDVNCYTSHLYAEHPRWHTELFLENYRGRIVQPRC